MYVSCLSCPSATFALQCDGVVPREWLATEPVDLDEYELIRINQEVEKIEVLVNQFCRVFRAEVVRILDVLSEN